jgi:NADH dehydrogenase (ubiquinone) 1 alpha subcomplex subunit 10
MAGLASKLVSLLPGAKPSNLLSAAVNHSKVCTANINSRTSGNMEEPAKPWNYKKYGYNYFLQVTEGTTKRFNDNTKVICVEGPPGLQKTKFAKELAEEFGMLYVPGSSMDDYYINSYGYDLRDLDWQFHLAKNISFDEKKFAQDPMGGPNGLDMMQLNLQTIRAYQYNNLLAHLFNTGQGVVTEKSPHSEYVFIEAAYKMGWIDKTSRIYFYKKRMQINQYMLRPNVIIYLDAPTDVVQAKLRERSKTTHPWEANSPVFENSAYLKMVYDDYMKNEYLKEAAVYSKVLTYNWSEEGDTEVVVEDVERLQLEYFDKYDKQQSDWRRYKEDGYSQLRRLYTLQEWVNHACHNIEYLDAENCMRTFEEEADFLRVACKLPGNMFAKGMNKELGESAPLFFQNTAETASFYNVDKYVIDDQEMEMYFKEREEKRLAGEQNWWNL